MGISADSVGGSVRLGAIAKAVNPTYVQTNSVSSGLHVRSTAIAHLSGAYGILAEGLGSVARLLESAADSTVSAKADTERNEDMLSSLKSKLDRAYVGSGGKETESTSMLRDAINHQAGRVKSSSFWMLGQDL